MKKALLVVSTLLAVGTFIVYSGGREGVPLQISEPSAAVVQMDDYKITVKATAVSSFEVLLNVNTNIPLPVEVMASLSIKGQNPQDTYIGVSERVRLTSPEQIITIDGTEENLPSGDYVAEVSFYSRWGAENGSEAAKQITSDIIGQSDVTLSGSGESKNQADEQNIAQRWVMLNVDIGMPWNEGLFVERLGQFSTTASTLNLHDAYYFEDADMTIIVSRAHDTVAVWRMGRATQ